MPPGPPLWPSIRRTWRPARRGPGGAIDTLSSARPPVVPVAARVSGLAVALSFLVSGAGAQTLVVALFYNVFAGGVRPVYSVDAMALMYMTTVLLLLLVALRFVRPTQIVFRIDQPPR